MYFRISSNVGADNGPIFGDSLGLYIGNPQIMFGKGALLNFESELARRTNVGSTINVPLVRVKDQAGVTLGVEKSLGEIYGTCVLRSVVNQVSGPDFDAALSMIDMEALITLENENEIDINVLVVNSETIVHPRIEYLEYLEYLEYDGEIFKVLSITGGAHVYSRGNAIPVRVSKI